MAPTNASVALSATWDDFVAECQAAFPQAELTKASSVESTKVKLAKLIPSDSEQSKQRSKNVMLVLEGVKVIGGVVAKSASLVFGPAEVCGNAITLVVDGIKKGTAACEDVTALMERMAAFLDTLSIHVQADHPTDTPRELANPCEQVLRHFLIVLRQIYKLTHSKWERFKTIIKAILDDDEIKNSLEQMEALISRYTSTEVSTILAKVSSQAQDLGKLRKGVDRLVDSQNLEDIQKLLAVGKNHEENEHLHRLITSEVLEGTGLWLTENDEELKAWADLVESASPIYAICELRRSGQTMLSNHIIRHLRRTREPDAKVAYYYFSEPLVKSNALGVSLCCLMWQLVLGDAEYGQAIAKKLKENKDSSTPLSLWQSLYNKDVRRSAIYIVLDGLHDIDPRVGDILARMIADVSANKHIPYRLCIAGRPGAWRTIHAALRAMGASAVDTKGYASRGERRNARDIEIYIEHHLKKGLWDTETRDLINRTMIESLPAADLFPELDRYIGNLNKCLLKQSVEQQLLGIRAQCKQARIEKVAIAVERHDTKLSPEQIAELNFILAWLVALGGSCPIALLDEALTLENPAKCAGSSVADRVEPYSSFLHVGPRRESLHVNGSIDLVGYMDSSLARERHDKIVMERRLERWGARLKGFPTVERSPRRTVTMPDHEVELMRAFLKTFLKEGMYEKFGFDAFLDSKLKPSERRPRRPHRQDPDPRTAAAPRLLSDIDKPQSHCVVIRTCFRALLLNRSAESASSRIHSFSQHRLAEHLDAGRGRGFSDPTITPLLLQFLQNPILPTAWRVRDPRDQTPHLRDLCRAMKRWLLRADLSRYAQDGPEVELIVSFRSSAEPEEVLLARLRARGGNVEADDAVGGHSRSG